MTPNHRWTKGAYSCHKCGTVSKDYRACDVGQCDHLCGDLYADAREADSCKAGCAHYQELQEQARAEVMVKNFFHNLPSRSNFGAGWGQG